MSGHSKPVKFVATLLNVPKAICLVPAIIKEELETFRADVADERKQREIVTEQMEHNFGN